jgi:ABC-type spermidine/putrescine transport system permease subunit I
VVQLPLTSILPEQPDTFFVIYNGMNDFVQQILDRYDQFVSASTSNLQTFDSIRVRYLVVSICIIIVSAFAFTVMLGKTLYAKQLILSVFLDIPEKTALYLYSKCEAFLSQLSTGDDDEA